MIATPSVDKAVRYLERLLLERNPESGTPLPTVAKLALDAEVSLVSMWKAVRRLAEKGVLVTRRGAGVYVAPAVSSNGKSNLVQSLSRRIVREVLEGRFHNDQALPSVKELGLLYDVGPAAMRDAIAGLVQEGRLVKRGRDFLIRRHYRSTAGGASVQFICGDDFAAQTDVGYFRTTVEQFLHYFEYQCSRRNVRLERIVVTDASKTRISSSPGTLGHLIWITAALEPFLESLIEQCVRRGCPAVVYNQQETDLEKLRDLPGKTLRILCNDNVAAGRSVGDALLHLGHRRVCCIVEKLWPWAHQRYAGLASAFEKAGYPDAVHLIQGDEYAQAPRRQPELWMKADRDKRFIDSLSAQLGDGGLDDGSSRRVAERLHEAAYRRALYCVLEGPMRTALRDIGATAWVAADDYIGLYAVLPFLQSQHVHVPRDLSLVSFNDQLEAGNACMSSYHFDMTGMAMRMLTFLLYPAQERRLRPGRQSSALEGIDGFVVDHGSLAGISSRSVN